MEILKGYMFFTITSDLNEDQFMTKVVSLFNAKYTGIDNHGVEFNVNKVVLDSNASVKDGENVYKFEFNYDGQRDESKYKYDRWEQIVMNDIIAIGVTFLQNDIVVTVQKDNKYHNVTLYPNDFSYSTKIKERLGRA